MNKKHEELQFLESDGVVEKYICPETNRIYEFVGVNVVPREEGVKKYNAIVYWSKNQSVVKQAANMKKICSEFEEISDKEILELIRTTEKWNFGEFYAIDARKILDLGEKYNLDIRMVDLKQEKII